MMSKAIDFVELQEIASKVWARNRSAKVAPLQKRHSSEIVLLRNVFRNPPQPLPKPHDLLHRVVMHRTDAHHAAARLQPQTGGNLQGIIIPIPHIDIGFV